MNEWGVGGVNVFFLESKERKRNIVGDWEYRVGGLHVRKNIIVLLLGGLEICASVDVFLVIYIFDEKGHMMLAAIPFLRIARYESR